MVRRSGLASRLVCATLAAVVITSLIAACGGSGESSDGRDAITGIAVARQRSLASSKAASTSGECGGIAPRDYGRSGLCADSGFRRADLLPFANWSGQKYPADMLTAGNLTALFGESVCANVDGDTCTLTNGAVKFLEELQKAYLNGRCEGMVVLASLLASKALEPVDIDDSAVASSAVDPNADEVQRAIGFWWTTQYSPEVAEATAKTRDKGVKEVIRQLEVKLSSGTFATMGLYFKGMGHALLPVGLMRGPDGVYEVVVYDSNLPDSFATVDLDPQTDTWTYRFGAVAGDADAQVWTGLSGDIDLTPMSSRAARTACVYCEDDSPSGVRVSLGAFEVPGREAIDSTYR